MPELITTIAAGNRDDLDTTLMRSGAEQAIDITRREGTLASIGDRSTEIGAITLSSPNSPAGVLIRLLGSAIADTPEARQAAERLVASLTREFPRQRIVLLDENDRIHLISGMVSMRRDWEASGDGWISDVIYNGYDGYRKSPDTELLEAAFCDNPILEHLDNDADRLGVLRVLARPEVLEIICSPERAQPVNDFEAFACHVAGAVCPMKGAGRTARPEQVLEAMKLHGLILQRLAQRLGVDEYPEEEPDPTEAPRG